MTKSDEKWLFERDLAQMEQDRLVYDLDGWEDRPQRTFAASAGTPWLEGDVTEQDRSVAAAIRERVKRLRG